MASSDSGEPVEPQEPELVTATLAEVPDEQTPAPPLPRSSQQRDKLILTLAVVAVLLAAVLKVHNRDGVAIPLVNWRVPETCYARALWGLPCPGCGLTRSWIATAHGNVQEAWNFNPIGTLLFVLCVLQIPYRGLRLFASKENTPISPTSDRWSTIAFWALAGGLIVQWVVRLALGTLPP